MLHYHLNTNKLNFCNSNTANLHMPIIHQQVINQNTQLGVWHITEPLDFFINNIVVQKNITHPQKQLQHAAGRFLLKLLQPSFPIADIQIATNSRPFLQNEAFHFSISHCGFYAAAIVSKSKAVGIDVEIQTPKLLKLQQKFLSQQEIEQFGLRISNEANIVMLTILWSAKEALFKWWGKGEIDFKQHLYIHPFQLQQQGVIKGIFSAHAIQEQIKMQYYVFEKFVLVYTV
jgi:phosphopantetheinyl transferase